MYKRASKQNGFTIVELLIVIVIIAILAAITIVAFNGVQNRAKDTARLNGVAQIMKALEIYKSFEGRYPDPVVNDPSGWEVSSQAPQNFLKALRDKNVVSGSLPVDPVNDSTHRFVYFRYAAGDRGCDASKGAFYVLGIVDMSTSNGIHPANPGFACTGSGGRNWNDEHEWVTGRFENG